MNDTFVLNKIQRKFFMNSIQFNTHFSLEDNSYFDIPINTDILRYVDPNLLGIVNHPYFDSVTAKNKVTHYFLTAFNAYKQGEKDLAIKLITYPKEMNEVHFGYSKKTAGGTGPSVEILDTFFSTITNGFGELQRELASKPILLPLFVKNFGSDRFSDLIVCIISKELSEFTEKICNKHDLETYPVTLGKHYNIESKEWEALRANLPLDLDGRPIVLIPKEIVVKEYGFSAEHYVNSVITKQLQHFHYENRTAGLINFVEKKGVLVAVKPTLVQVKEKELNQKYPDHGKFKEFALDYSLNFPDSLGQYIELLEGKRIYLHKR